MTQQTGEVCMNCRQLVQTYRFKVLVVQKTKTLTYQMQMCGVCAHQLTDTLESASGETPEVFDASEGSRSAQKSGQGRASNSPQAGDRPGTPGVRPAAATR